MPDEVKPTVVPRAILDEEIRFCELILDGYSPSQAMRKLDLGSSAEQADALFWNPEVQAYLAARRMELTDGRFKSKRDPAVEDAWFNDVVNLAFANFVEVIGQDIKEPRDLLKLPKRLQLLVKGCKWDQKGRFVIEFEDRAAARESVARYMGLYQKDRANDRDAVNLLQTVFWRFVISRHLATGLPTGDCMSYAQNNPDEVQAWGVRHHLIGPGGET